VQSGLVACFFPRSSLFDDYNRAEYGLFAGLLVECASKVLAACLCFVFSRLLLRGYLRAKIRYAPVAQALVMGVGHGGWKFVTLARLMPLPISVHAGLVALTDTPLAPQFLMGYAVGQVRNVF
jgi:uncharacterized membrane protein YdjX (TVP38/TMEM64 family)